jgi:uncharacterized protein
MGCMKRYKLLLMAALFTAGCTNNHRMNEKISTYALRLKPGEDLQQGIAKAVAANKIEAGWIATTVGSLSRYTIRFANQPGPSDGEGHFEIVSLVGTVSINGSHLHLSISDSTGKTIGGHLLQGCTVYTTAEIVITATDKYQFERRKDGSTPWDELQVMEKRE